MRSRIGVRLANLPPSAYSPGLSFNHQEPDASRRGHNRTVIRHSAREIFMTAGWKLAAAFAPALIGGAIALLSISAFAQNAQQACAGDIKTYCAGVSQGEGRVAQCLRSHKEQLSPGCQRGMAQATTLMKEVVQACEDDMHRYCAGAAPGTAKECLRANFRELSFGCKRELFEAKKGM
jgi:hypothetical protein